MDHRDIKELLSPYIDGALSPEEKARVEEHLTGCNECSGTLAQLREAVSRIRSLNEVEPPPFLSRKIMKEIKKETRYPLRMRIPLEAAAVIAVAFTSLYIYKTYNPPLKTEASKEYAASEVSREGPAPKEPKRYAQETEKKIGMAGHARAPRASATMGKASPTSTGLKEKKMADAVRTEAETRTAAPPAADMTAMKAEPMAAAPPTAKAPPVAQMPAPIAPMEEQAAPAKAAGARAMRMKAASLEKEPREVRLTLIVEDLEVALKKVEDILHQAGATQMKTESLKDKKIQTALVPSLQLPKVLEKFKPLGELKGAEPALVPKEPSLRIFIEIERRP